MSDEQHRQQPPYDPSARRATPLAAKLHAHISEHGPISVANYMDMCFRDPEYGYYIQQPAIGAHGDFITAPEISQIFGELIGIWCALVWQQMGAPEKLNLLELGPGRGTLMADALRALAKLPKLSSGLHIHLLETNIVLRQQQASLLTDKATQLTHHIAPASICDAAAKSDTPWIVIGNEFLDALGVRQLIVQNGAWHERMVTCDRQGQLVFATSPAAPPPASNWPTARSASDETICETMPGLETFVTPLLQSLQRTANVAALFIDYGYTQTEFGETLQAVRGHSYEHPLTSPGEADLTAHVNFAEVAHALEASGLTPHSLITQAELLGRLGIIERASHLMSANTAESADIEAATLRLMAPNGMGGRFKAIAASSPKLRPLPVFNA